jgi:RimJ/RimL family protein N-acetyltransferase
MERLEMKAEGRLREASFKDEQWYDLLYYGILENEWRP